MTVVKIIELVGSSKTSTDDAARRVHDFTKQHVGRNLALVVDGKVHGTPQIAAAVTGNRYRIEGFNRADAERPRLYRRRYRSCRRGRGLAMESQKADGHHRFWGS